MALTDAQIERYSRQIILPEIGGRGQEDLLRSRVTIIGTGPLAEAVVPYLVGAGIGHLLLRPAPGEEASAAARLAARAAQINPEARTNVAAPLATVHAEGPVACDVLCETSGRRDSTLSVVRVARIAGTAIVSGGVAPSWGWLGITATKAMEPGCVFCGRLEAGRGGSDESTSPFAPTVVGALAALAAASVLGVLLGRDRARRGRWLRYDAETMTLEEHSITRHEECPVCGNGTGEGPCHPTLDS